MHIYVRSTRRMQGTFCLVDPSKEVDFDYFAYSI